MGNDKKPTKRKNLLVDHPAWADGLSKEWDWEKNDENGVKPDEVTAGSGKKVAWKCEHGHTWEASVLNRKKGRGCPYCSGRLPILGETDLQTLVPELAREWHPTKNGDLTPRDVVKGSQKKVWWQCERGHEWPATVASRTRGNGCPYCSGRLPIVGVTDLATLMPSLASEWHPTKNGDLTPRDVARHSGKKVWWLCPRCGHTWQTTVDHRSRGVGCAVCAGKRVQAGFNDLATTDPDVAKEWHPTKNGDLTPQDVTRSSAKKVWWRCANGHSWPATVANRTSGNGCAICAGKRIQVGCNDLATTDPAIAAEWHPTKNGDLTPQDVTRGSAKKVWWLCPRCGHTWQATANDRSRGRGCAVCAGKRVQVGCNDLATTDPAIAAEWHPTKNGDLTPQDVTRSSAKKVWWRCGGGHEWPATVANRTSGNGCAVCAGKRIQVGCNDLATTDPAIAAEWHPTKNGDLTPQGVTRGSSRKVWWLCPECGHAWQTTVSSRTSGSGCPVCPSSNGEKNSAFWARSIGFVVEKQWRDPACCDQRPLPFDMMLFAPAGTALMEVAVIEYDGEQHSNPDTYFNKKNLTRGGFDYVQRHDAIKDAYCEATGRLLIRVPYTITGVEDIGAYIEAELRKDGFGWWFDEFGGDAA